MKAFVFKTFIFLVAVFLVDRFFIVFRTGEINVFADIATAKMEIVSEKFHSEQQFDLLILGSSHAQFGISPEVVESELGIKALNIAYGDGANMGKQKSIIENIIYDKTEKLPKAILFALDVFTLNNEPQYDDQYMSILFGSKNVFTNLKNQKWSNSFFKLYARNIPDYFKNIQDGNLTLPIFEKKNAYDLSMFSAYNGYEITPLGWVKGYGLLNKNYLRYANMQFAPNKKALLHLKEISEICRQKGIQLIIVQVPEHEVCLMDKNKYNTFDVFATNFSQEHNIPYFNFNNEEEFQVSNDSLFFDSDHLNHKGAIMFSKSLANKLKPFLK